MMDFDSVVWQVQYKPDWPTARPTHPELRRCRVKCDEHRHCWLVSVPDDSENIDFWPRPQLNRIELDSVKKQLEDHWKNIQRQLRAQPAPELKDAAGIRRWAAALLSLPALSLCSETNGTGAVTGSKWLFVGNSVGPSQFQTPTYGKVPASNIISKLPNLLEQRWMTEKILLFGDI